MSFMEVAIVSVIGGGLLGYLGILVQFLLKQNSQRRDDHEVAMGAIHEQGIHMARLHTKTVDLIRQEGRAARQHADELHREAIGAIAAQGTRMEQLHTKAMDAIAAQGTRMEQLHTKAMDAIAALDREHREHREKLHTETMTQIAALSERTAVLETKIALPGSASA